MPVPTTAERPSAAELVSSDPPRLRGVLHQVAAFVWLAAGVGLFVIASGIEARIAALVYAFGVTTMFGVSALYHRVRWSPHAKYWWRRADHSAIYLAIAGTYTPIALRVLSPTAAALVLTIVWGGAVVGVTLNLSWGILPGWLQYTLYIGLGWTAVFFLPQLGATLGLGWIALLLGGGVLYTAGAILLALERPNPSPRWFGYHEVWHGFTIAAAAVQLIVVAAIVA